MKMSHKKRYTYDFFTTFWPVTLARAMKLGMILENHIVQMIE